MRTRSSCDGRTGAKEWETYFYSSTLGLPSTHLFNTSLYLIDFDALVRECNALCDEARLEDRADLGEFVCVRGDEVDGFWDRYRGGHDGELDVGGGGLG